MHKLNRRDAISMAGTGAFVALGGATLAHASSGEDAELLRLWEEWKAQFAQCGVYNAHFNAVEERVFDEMAPNWKLERIGWGAPPEQPHQAIFTSYRNGEPQIKAVALVSAVALINAEAAAETVRDDLEREHHRSSRNARRRHKWHAANRAEQDGYDKLHEIEDQIAEAPVEV